MRVANRALVLSTGTPRRAHTSAEQSSAPIELMTNKARLKQEPCSYSRSFSTTGMVEN